MIETSNIPHYVYRDHITETSLLQGDILKVDGDFREHFKSFYPAIKHPDNEIKYVMVLTQSCDLVKTEKRKPKLNHINVCLVRSLDAVIRRVIDEEIKPVSISNTNLLPRDALDQLKDRISKLLNNTDQKTCFFLPNHKPFTEDMAALLPLSFSFRTEHYETLLNNRVLGLKSEFQAKIGYIISQLYGRIGTADLSDSGWSDKQIRDYINKLLQHLNLKQVPDKSFIDYIQQNFNDEGQNIDQLIQQHQAQKVAKEFGPLKNDLLQKIKTDLIRLFEDRAQIDSLLNSDKPTLSKNIKNLLQKITKDF